MADGDSNGGGARGDYVRFVGLGFTFMFLIGVFIAGGYLLDRVLGTLPLFVLLGIVAGFVVALYYLYVQLFRRGSG